MLKNEVFGRSGGVSYQIPVMKTQQYTLDEIFEKRLLFLIPFYIFIHESRFDEYENNAEKRELLKREVMEIMEKLEQMALTGEISEYEKCTIVDMTRKVVEKITAKYENVRKEVTSVMGGKGYGSIEVIPEEGITSAIRRRI